MRGKREPQSILFVASIDLDSRIRPDHPLRAIKKMADEELARMSRAFDAAYAENGRPSVPPERLIKALLLQAIYSVRSEAQLVERIDHDLLFRWFLDLRIDEDVFDATVFSHNRQRLQDHDLIAKFFDQTVRRAMRQGLISPDHFSVDGTLIEAYASIKSFKRKDSDEDDSSDKNGQAKPDPGFKSRNAEVDFHGEKRSNATHASSTDPDARLYRKGVGQEAKLCHALHALIENRNGLVVSVEVNSPLGNSEPNTAVKRIDRVKQRLGIKPRTLGADKGYGQGPYLQEIEKRRITPHSALKDGPIALQRDSLACDQGTQPVQIIRFSQ